VVIAFFYSTKPPKLLH